jgi:hypothetical protein
MLKATNIYFYAGRDLGESTPQGRYPPLLEELLNRRNTGKKYSVIDKGIAGTNT